jgi:predicted DNA-binding transcriptional regulator YafY
MPVNKNASFRYRVINRCLLNTGRMWTLNNLIDSISDEMYEQFGITKGISKRSVQNDISVMRSDPPRGFAAPIICEDGHYSYADSDYSIDNNPLNETDIENLSEAVTILKQFRHLPLYGEMQSMLSKLQENILQSNRETLVNFEHNPNYKNIDLLGSIYNLLKDGKKAIIRYQPFKYNNPREFSLSPLFLKEYRNRWFLFSWNEAFLNYTNLAVDRIISIEHLNEESDTSKKSELQAILNNVIGVTIPDSKTPELITFFVNTQSLDYFLTKPVHHSQQLIKKETAGALLQIEVIPNFELEQMLLSHGENLEVRSPESLRRHIKNRLIDTIQHYS